MSEPDRKIKIEMPKPRPWKFYPKGRIPKSRLKGAQTKPIAVIMEEASHD